MTNTLDWENEKRKESAIAQYEAAKDAYDSIRYNPAQMYGLNDS